MTYMCLILCLKTIEEGDTTASQKRMEAIEGIEELETTNEVKILAETLLKGPIPKKKRI